MMKFAFLVLFLPVMLLFGALLINGVFSMAPPGLWQRIHQSINSNIEETRDDHAYKEFITPVVNMPAAEALEKLRNAGRALNWQAVDCDKTEADLCWVITTRLLRFKDDVIVQLQPRSATTTALYIKSASRVGKGDLGANASHIRKLLKQIQ